MSALINNELLPNVLSTSVTRLTKDCEIKISQHISLKSKNVSIIATGMIGAPQKVDGDLHLKTDRFVIVDVESLTFDNYETVKKELCYLIDELVLSPIVDSDGNSIFKQKLELTPSSIYTDVEKNKAASEEQEKRNKELKARTEAINLPSDITSIIRQVIDENKNIIDEYNTGKTQAINSLIGKLIKLTDNKISAEVLKYSLMSCIGQKNMDDYIKNGGSNVNT